MKTIMKVQDVADFLQVSKRTIFRLAYKGVLPAPKKIGGSVRWMQEDIESFVKKSKTLKSVT